MLKKFAKSSPKCLVRLITFEGEFKKKKKKLYIGIL